MPFTQIAADIAQRLHEARRTQSDIARLELDKAARKPVRPDFDLLKGWQYVAVYSVVEFAFTRVSERLLAEIEAANPARTSLVEGILSIGLSPEFTSVAKLSGMKKLKQRAQTIAAARASAPLKLAHEVLAGELMSCSGGKVEELWSLLHLQGVAFPTSVEKALLNDLFERRCAVAHGRESADEAGRKITAAELGRRFNAVEALCNRLLTAAEAVVKAKTYC